MSYILHNNIKAEDIVENNNREQLLEARIQTLTEENDIIKKELTENNYWLDNQADLTQALQRVNQENEDLDNQIDELKEKIEKQEQKLNKEQSKTKNGTADETHTRMSFTQKNVTNLFTKPRTPEPQDRKQPKQDWADETQSLMYST